MTSAESDKIVDKIKVHRTMMSITTDTYSEWYKNLKEYDFVDIDKKLDDYLHNNDERIPTVHYLTRFVKKTTEKNKPLIQKVRCHLCHEVVNELDFDKHYSKCSSTEYIIKMTMKYFNQKLNRDKLMALNDVFFEEKYWSFCQQLLDKATLEEHETRGLINAIRTKNGENVVFNWTDIFEVKVIE